MLDSSPDFESFMEELEAQSVGHCFSWGYFLRSAQLGPFDMFSDVDSRISHLNKIGQMVRLLCLANLLIGEQFRCALLRHTIPPYHLTDINT